MLSEYAVIRPGVHVIHTAWQHYYSLDEMKNAFLTLLDRMLGHSVHLFNNTCKNTYR